MMHLQRQLLRAAASRPLVRAFSAAGAIDVSRLTVQRTTQPKERLPKEKLVFGHSFTDHMLEIDWTKQDGWGAPRITPYHDFVISPAASALHYALQCFEGMKAYKDAQGRIRLFRPECNLSRLNNSMSRLYMPNFDEPAFMECIKRLLHEDADWFPEGDGYSIYIRPTAISTYPFLGVGATESVKLYVILSPVGPYYPDGFKPVRLYADTEHVRACPGGAGNSKLGSNYGPSIAPQMEAFKKHKCHQILWLYGPEHRVTEVGSMNIFFLLKNDKGEKELVTPNLDTGDILPGVTRRSMLELARHWNEFKVSERQITMAELVEANEKGNLLEAFGAGTAAVIAPVNEIIYQDKKIVVPTGSGAGPLAQRMWDTLTDIQYGRVEHPWSVLV